MISTHDWRGLRSVGKPPVTHYVFTCHSLCILLSFTMYSPVTHYVFPCHSWCIPLTPLIGSSENRPICLPNLTKKHWWYWSPWYINDTWIHAYRKIYRRANTLSHALDPKLSSPPPPPHPTVPPSVAYRIQQEPSSTWALRRGSKAKQHRDMVQLLSTLFNSTLFQRFWEKELLV